MTVKTYVSGKGREVHRAIRRVPEHASNAGGYGIVTMVLVVLLAILFGVGYGMNNQDVQGAAYVFVPILAAMLFLTGLRVRNPEKRGGEKAVPLAEQMVTA